MTGELPEPAMFTKGAARSRVRHAARVAALIVLIVSALLSNLAHLKHLSRDDPAPDVLMLQRDQRFERLKDALPKRGTVGYLSDAPTWADREEHLMRAQFALAPLILVSGAEHALVVAELSDPAAAAKGRDPALTVVRDLGDGLILFAREPMLRSTPQR
jgi:hypothetical protein